VNKVESKRERTNEYGPRVFPRRPLLPTGQDEAVTVRIFEFRETTPWLPLGRRFELHASADELLVCILNIVAAERAIEERSDAVFVSFGRVQDYTGLRTRNGQFDPTFSRSHLPVGGDLETELPCPKGESAFLITRGYPDEVQLLYHQRPLRPATVTAHMSGEVRTPDCEGEAMQLLLKQ
jgi:hypothetical protein